MLLLSVGNSMILATEFCLNSINRIMLRGLVNIFARRIRTGPLFLRCGQHTIETWWLEIVALVDLVKFALGERQLVDILILTVTITVCFARFHKAGDEIRDEFCCDVKYAGNGTFEL